MLQATLPRRTQSIGLTCHVNDEEIKEILIGSCPASNYGDRQQKSTSSPMMKTNRAVSFNEEPRKSSPNNNNNRFKHLYTRFIRRFSLHREHYSQSEDMARSLSNRFRNYKSFSSSSESPFEDFEWPDFEKVYDSIPPCLVHALPGLDDISLDGREEDSTDTSDSIFEDAAEVYQLFERCERGASFRRNALCNKIDKTQYHGQLNTFVQQLLIEKLMRTWA